MCDLKRQKPSKAGNVTELIFPTIGVWGEPASSTLIPSVNFKLDYSNNNNADKLNESFKRNGSRSTNSSCSYNAPAPVVGSQSARHSFIFSKETVYKNHQPRTRSFHPCQTKRRGSTASDDSEAFTAIPALEHAKMPANSVHSWSKMIEATSARNTPSPQLGSAEFPSLRTSNSDSLLPRASSPFDDCSCTVSDVCDNCVSSYMSQYIADIPYTRSQSPESGWSESTSEGRSSPIEIESPGSSKSFCHIHPDEQNDYCYTCSEAFCRNCSEDLHVDHECHYLSDALEKCENQAKMIHDEIMHTIDCLHRDFSYLLGARKRLEITIKRAADDITAVALSTNTFKTKYPAKLLDKIAQIKSEQTLKIEQRQEALDRCVLFLNETVRMLTQAMKAAKKSINPLDQVLAKDKALSDLYRVRQFRSRCLPIKHIVSFTVNSNVQELEKGLLGRLDLTYPAPVGNRPFVQKTQYGYKPIRAARHDLRMPVPRGNAVASLSYSVIVWSEWYKPAKRQTKVLGATNEPKNNLLRPWGVACDKFGHIVVADRSNHRIQIYREDGFLIRSFGQFGLLPGQFDRPAGVAIDACRRIVVADKDNHRIQILTMKGEFLIAFGGLGKNFGQFEYPWDVAVNSECQIVVSDSKNYRVQLFSAHGIFLKSFGLETPGRPMDLPRGVAFNPQGNVVVNDFNRHRVIELDHDFAFANVIFGGYHETQCNVLRPQGIAIDDEGNIVIADSRNYRIQVRDKYGNYRRTFGTAGNGINNMDRPAGIALTASGRIVVVDFGNNRVLLI